MSRQPLGRSVGLSVCRFVSQQHFWSAISSFSIHCPSQPHNFHRPFFTYFPCLTASAHFLAMRSSFFFFPRSRGLSRTQENRLLERRDKRCSARRAFLLFIRTGNLCLAPQPPGKGALTTGRRTDQNFKKEKKPRGKSVLLDSCFSFLFLFS